jgi:hypothetical protein
VISVVDSFKQRCKSLTQIRTNFSLLVKCCFLLLGQFSVELQVFWYSSELPCVHLNGKKAPRRRRKKPRPGAVAVLSDRQMVMEFISNTGGRGVGGRYVGWRGFARSEFSSSPLE